MNTAINRNIMAFTGFALLTVSQGVAGQGWPADQWLDQPVGDEIFGTYLDFFRYDDAIPLDRTVREVTDQDGMRVELITYVGTPGEIVTAHHYAPSAGNSIQRPYVILLHGGGRRGKMGMARLAGVLVREGFNALALDMKHFGERESGLMETFTELDKHEKLYNQESLYLSWAAQTVKDVGRGYDLLVTEYGADSEKIALIGNSRGAVAAMIAGGADHRLAAVGVINGGHFDRGERKHMGAACPANYIPRIGPRPLFFLNGQYDSDFDPERSVRPIHVLAPDAEILWAEAGHEYPSEESLEIFTDWLGAAIL